MNDLRLKDWTNIDRVGTRFPPSEFNCPNCGQKALNDNWPSIAPRGSRKFVCVSCRIAFRASCGENAIKYSFILPLVKQDNYLLTPYDVWREHHKQEYGEYPMEPV